MEGEPIVNRILLLLICASLTLSCAHLGPNAALKQCDLIQLKQPLENTASYRIHARADNQRRHLVIALQRQTNGELAITGINPLGAKLFDATWAKHGLDIKAPMLSDTEFYHALILGLVLSQHNLETTSPCPKLVFAAPNINDKHGKAVYSNVVQVDSHFVFKIPSLGYTIAASTL